jgi:hypothetical protein
MEKERKHGNFIQKGFYFCGRMTAPTTTPKLGEKGGKKLE